MKKFLSRKFLISLFVMLTSLFLKIFSIIDDNTFIILFFGGFIVFEFFEGTLDLKNISLKANGLEIKSGGKKDG